MKYILQIFVLLFIAVNISAQKIDEKHFNRVDQFLTKYVKDGKVDYTSLRLNNDLDILIDEIENVDLSNSKPSLQKAFYINAYNLHVINNIVEEGELKSVMDVKDFFESRSIIVAGRKLSLNGLEKDMIFRKFPDPRLHFVLVCGAIGCPPLASIAYRPSRLETQLTERTKMAFDDPSFIKLVGDSLRLSKIFKWYKSDFGNNDIEVVEYINQYKTDRVPTAAALQFVNYDWTLNGG